MLCYVGSSLRPWKDHCFFAFGSIRFSSRVALSRRASKASSNSFRSNLHLHHANPHDKLSAPFIHVAKYWVSKSMLANPSGSKLELLCTTTVNLTQAVKIDFLRRL